MPKRFRQSSIRRFAKKRRRRSRRRLTKLTNIVPATKTVKLRYVEQFTLDGTTGVNAATVFRANSIHDPNFSGVGHQPLGHDQWAAFYDHYNVIGSKISVKFVSTGGIGNRDSYIVGILLKDNSTTIPSAENIMEQTNSGYKICTTAAAMQTVTVRKGYSARKFFNLKDVKDNRALVGAQFNNNPTEDAYFHVYQAPLSSVDDPLPVRCIATIEYICQLTERKSLASS